MATFNQVRRMERERRAARQRERAELIAARERREREVARREARLTGTRANRKLRKQLARDLELIFDSSPTLARVRVQLARFRDR